MATVPRHRVLLGSSSNKGGLCGWRHEFRKRAAHAIEENAARSVSALGLGLSEFAVLEVLLHKGPQLVNVIGKKVLLSSGSITAAVDRLESKKLVRRTANTADLRARIVQLTATGRHLIQRAFQQHAIDMEETMAVLRSSERTELVRLLKKVGMWAAARLDDKNRREWAHPKADSSTNSSVK
jgi:MarR family 2-MHQ and catechol resistance regulon transcriptional repressor